VQSLFVWWNQTTAESVAVRQNRPFRRAASRQFNPVTDNFDFNTWLANGGRYFGAYGERRIQRNYRGCRLIHLIIISHCFPYISFYIIGLHSLHCLRVILSRVKSVVIVRKRRGNGNRNSKHSHKPNRKQKHGTLKWRRKRNVVKDYNL
jgi:hypothetical protein